MLEDGSSCAADVDAGLRLTKPISGLNNDSNGQSNCVNSRRGFANREETWKTPTVSARHDIFTRTKPL
ncbi:hypothetical protein EMPG_15488, partial [Blastomyces silverae]